MNKNDDIGHDFVLDLKFDPEYFIYVSWPIVPHLYIRARSPHVRCYWTCLCLHVAM